MTDESHCNYFLPLRTVPEDTERNTYEVLREVKTEARDMAKERHHVRMFPFVLLTEAA